MFVPFFDTLRRTGVPVSLREYLSFLEAMRAGLATYDPEAFYYLARTAMVKDERHIDRFDRAFAEAFKGLDQLSAEGVLEALDLPEDWLRKMAEKHMSDEEKAEIEALGGFDALMETLKERLKEQQGRHQGGSKWIGTAGTSPFGAYGYNPEGVRIGQSESRHQRAVKVWDKREFRNLDDSVELGTRNIKVALKRLRRWARDGAADELDLDGTIRATAEHGYLDVQTRPEKRNAVKVILFLDIGGSMDPHVKVVEELFSPRAPNSNILSISTSTTAFMKAFGRTIAAAGTRRHRRWTFSTPMGRITNASSSGMPECPPTRLPMPGARMNTGTPKPVGSGWSGRGRNGRTMSGSTRHRNITGTTPSRSR